MMKRNLSLLMALVLILSIALVGCKSKDNEDDTTNPPGVNDPVDGENSDGADGGTDDDGNGDAPGAALSGSASEVLTTLLSDAGIDVGATFEDPVTTETAQGNLGLSEEDFGEYVEEAYVSTAAVNAHAHLVAVIKCKDDASAAAVKELVASGFDSHRWVCVLPEQSFVMEAGSYVLLGATGADNAEALKTAFTTMAGESIGSANVFFDGVE